jgi:alpha-L-rhamnosidase
MTDVNTVVNAYAAGALRALSVLAEATGRHDEATRLEDVAAALGDAITSQLFDTSTGLFVDGQGGKAGSHSAWHAQAFPLFFGLSDTSDGRLFDFLQTKRMTGSVYAAFAFLLGLYRIGTDHGAFALEMMTNCDDNSWCNMIKQGATVTMEAWTREEKPNLSWSHPWATAPASAIVQGLMGIQATQPAFKHFEVRPQPGSLAQASIKLPTLPGFIEASIQNAESEFQLSLVVPGNTQATACLPRMGNADKSVTVDGAAVSGHFDGDFVCVDNLGSGHHTVLRAASVRFV